MNLFKSIKMEYSKVQWPRKNEIITSTAWVITMTLLISAYLGVFDFIVVRCLKVLEALI